VSYTATAQEITIYPKVRLDALRLGAARGGYVLIVRLDAKKNIQVGSLGIVSFPRALYAYLGSALGGFKSRLNRHLAEHKKPKWHIDYLLSEGQVLQIILCETERRLECLLSQALVDRFAFIPGFGSSDCQCKSHLYFANDAARLESGIGTAIAEVALPHESFKEVKGV
jgi:Uri superfamily endonuclease